MITSCCIFFFLLSRLSQTYFHASAYDRLLIKPSVRNTNFIKETHDLGLPHFTPSDQRSKSLPSGVQLRKTQDCQRVARNAGFNAVVCFIHRKKKIGGLGRALLPFHYAIFWCSWTPHFSNSRTWEGEGARWSGIAAVGDSGAGRQPGTQLDRGSASTQETAAQHIAVWAKFPPGHTIAVTAEQIFRVIHVERRLLPWRIKYLLLYLPRFGGQGHLRGKFWGEEKQSVKRFGVDGYLVIGDSVIRNSPVQAKLWQDPSPTRTQLPVTQRPCCSAGVQGLPAAPLQHTVVEHCPLWQRNRNPGTKGPPLEPRGQQHSWLTCTRDHRASQKARNARERDRNHCSSLRYVPFERDCKKMGWLWMEGEMWDKLKREHPCWYFCLGTQCIKVRSESRLEPCLQDPQMPA